MKLSHPFCRLPLRIDAQRLQAEARQFAEADWTCHPTGFSGNSALRLITVEGGDNDDMIGRMQPTPLLQRCPYIRQILAGFGVVWSRSRLMRLEPGAIVPEHCDINYHWFNRVRVHIPVQTHPAVSFRCGSDSVHMAEGEAWIFDNWRHHEVRNDSPHTRIHLVADTTGSAAFWRLVAAGQTENFQVPQQATQAVPFRPGVEAQPQCERHVLGAVMHPSEVEMLTGDLLSELRAPQSSAEQALHRAFVRQATEFCREWRQLWTLYGDTEEGWPLYQRLRDFVRNDLGRFAEGPYCAVNGMMAENVWRARVLMHACRGARPATPDLDRTLSAASAADADPAPASGPAIRRGAAAEQPIRQPLFIVAAPRSGSTLLYETLSQAGGLLNLGGEAHWLVENFPQLAPGAPGVDSNRLTAAHAGGGIDVALTQALRQRLRDRGGNPAVPEGPVRLLEKTPKNALRIPFFDAIFPDARYIFLWRDPRENLSSIIEAWRSGGWITYRDLPGWQGPWSLLLPPGWRQLAGRSLEEVAAFQWASTNQTVLDDLAALPRERWTSLSYADFLRDPATAMRRLCAFGGVAFDAHLQAHLERPLPMSRYTLTPPAQDKWKKNADAIDRVLPGLDALHRRLQALEP